MSASHFDTIVVGAGLAGLCASRDCARAGQKVLLLERKSHVGGSTFSLDSPLGLVDNSLHLMLGCYSECNQLFKELKIEQDLIRLPASYPLLSRSGALGKLYLPPWARGLGIVCALLGCRIFTMAERLKLLRAMVGMAASKARPAENMNSYLQRLKPAPVARVFFAEWALSVFNAEMTTLDARLFRHTALQMFASSKAAAPILFRRPMQQALIDPLLKDLSALSLRLERGCALQSFEKKDGLWHLRCGERRFSCQSLLLATSLPGLRKLAQDRKWSEQLPKENQALGIANLHVTVTHWPFQESLVGTFGSPWQFVFQHRADECPGELILVASAIKDCRAAELKESGLKVLKNLGLKPVSEPWLLRQQRAIEVQTPEFQSARRGEFSPEKGLWLCGAWCDPLLPLTMEAALSSGRRAARAILSH